MFTKNIVCRERKPHSRLNSSSRASLLKSTLKTYFDLLITQNQPLCLNILMNILIEIDDRLWLIVSKEGVCVRVCVHCTCTCRWTSLSWYCKYLALPNTTALYNALHSYLCANTCTLVHISTCYSLCEPHQVAHFCHCRLALTIVHDTLPQTHIYKYELFLAMYTLRQ